VDFKKLDMKKQLLLCIAMLFLALSNNAQVNSVALVGEAAGGWPGDPGNPGPTDVHQMSTTDGVNWTLSAITLTSASSGGGVKFRANNDWAINWGATNFPSGTATPGGSNIVCLAGTYNVTFNSSTGVYNFSGTPITYPSISLIGDAAAGWTTDVPLNTTDGVNYTLNNYTFVNGYVKFRKDNNWTVNWGASSFPTGTGVQGGADIPVPAGTYNVSFNINTGSYVFSFPLISVVGTAAIDWNTDIDMQTSDGLNYTLSYPSGFNLGELKFRQDHNWTTNWGNTAFPSGTGTQGGNNIVVTATGFNFVSFNRITGNYNFVGLLNTNTFNNAGLSYYPNPTTTNWNFNSKESIDSIEIIDVLGKTIFKTSDKSETIVIDAAQFNSGVYFAKITIANAIQTVKLIKN